MSQFNSKEFLRELSEELVTNFEKASRATTPGLIGSAREHEVRKKLENALPAGVGVGTGCVIDYLGNASKQQDIILFEKSICPRFALNEAPDVTYYPCEGVIAVGEIKSSIGKAEIVDAFSKIESVKSLRRLAIAKKSPLHGETMVNFRKYLSMTAYAGAPQEMFDQAMNDHDQIWGFILCGHFSVQDETLASHIKDQLDSATRSVLPNMLISLRDGLIVPFNSGNNCLSSAVTEGTGYVYGQSETGSFEYLLAKLFQIIRTGRTVECSAFEHYLIHEPSKMTLSIKKIIE
jgi:hypothetical protein